MNKFLLLFLLLSLLVFQVLCSVPLVPCPSTGILDCSAAQINSSSAVVSSDLALSNCLYISCPSLLISSRLSLSLQNVTFRNSMGPAISILATDANVTLNKVQFINSSFSLDSNGTASITFNLSMSSVLFSASSSLSINTFYPLTSSVGNIVAVNSRFTGAYNNGASNGGVFQIQAVSTNFTATNCSFDGNGARGYGGAISLIGSDIKASFTNCTFTSNSCLKKGAALCFAATSGLNSLKVQGSLFQSNNAAENGGAIYVVGSGGNIDFSVINSVIIKNMANYGGAIYASSSSPLGIAINASTFSGNVAQYLAGAVHVDSPVTYFKVSSCSFSSNGIESTSRGGSIYFSPGDLTSTITVRDSSFSGDRASYGGSIGVDSGSLTVLNCVFSNTSALTGGSIAMGGGSLLTVDRCSFSNIRSKLEGGAILMESVSNGVITNCVATGVVGLYYGGFFYQADGILSMSNCSVRDSSASAGGVLFNNGGKSTVRNCQIINVMAQDGGGFQFVSSAVGIMDNCYFQNMTALNSAGVLFLSYAKSMVMTNCVVMGTRARLSGAISILDLGNTGTASFTNISVFNVYVEEYGGLGYFYDSLRITFDGLTLDGCIGNFDVAIEISLAAVTIRNSNFSNILATSGSTAIYLELVTGTPSTFTNCRFVNVSAVTGGVFWAYSNNVNLNNCYFGGTSAVFGGVIYLSSTSRFTCLNCVFQGSLVASALGSLAYVSETSYLTLVNSQIKGYNSPSTRTLIYLLSGSFLTITGLSTDGFFISPQSTFLSLMASSSATISGLDMALFQCTSSGAASISIDGQSSLQLSDSSITDCQGDNLIKATSGSTVSLVNTAFTYSAAATATLNVIYASDNSVVSMSHCSVTGFQGDGSAIVMTGASEFDCAQTTFSQIEVKESPIKLMQSVFRSASCSLIDNMSQGLAVGSTCAGGGEFIISKGGAIAAYGSRVYLEGGTIIMGNQAEYGGGIYSSGPDALVYIGEGTVIFQNQASMEGGAIFASLGTFVYFGGQGSNLNLTENEALNFPSSSLMSFINTASFLDTPNAIALESGGIFSSDSTIKGNIYLDDLVMAQAVIQANLSTVVPATWRAGASNLKVTGYPNGSVILVNMLDDYFPILTVTAYDPFDQIAIVPDSSPLVIQLSLNGPGNLLGENTKLLPSSSVVIFDDLSVAEKVPSVPYILSIGADAISPTILTIIYQACDPEKESVYLGRCIPVIRNTSGQVNAAVASLSGVLFVVFAVSFCLLVINREFSIIKANSATFLSTSQLGSLIAVISPIFSIINGKLCFFNLMVENLGFTLVFASIIIKLYRIRMIFQSSKNLVVRTPDQVKRLQDPYLIRYLIAIMLLMTGYLLVWLFLDPPPSDDGALRYVASLNSMVQDHCPLTSPFAIFLLSIKFMAVLVLSYFAYLIRDLPAAFNEAKFIAFACYNWLIFGNLLFLMGQYLVDSPDLKSLVVAVSIFSSHSLITAFLVVYKIYQMYTNGASSKISIDAQSTTNQGSISVPGESFFSSGAQKSAGSKFVGSKSADSKSVEKLSKSITPFESQLSSKK